MSTSLLYHAFGIKGYDYVRTQYHGGNIIFTIERKPFCLCCPCCKGKDIIRHGALPRWFYSVPLGGRPSYIVTYVTRIECKQCRITRQADIGFADKRVTYTKALERYALGLARHMTIKDVANHLGISWDIVKGMQKRHLKKRYKNPKLKELQLIAVDEINIGKGRYFTVVLNFKTGAIVFVGDGKGSEALEPFWVKLKRKNSVKIKAVAMDMSRAYIKAVTENLPNATIVFDHFHVIKLFNEKLSDFRRKLFDTAHEIMKKSVLKGSRWLLLTAREKLADKQNHKVRLERALALNEPLATAYYMKEDLRQLWGWGDDKHAATWHLDSWIEMAKASGMSMLEKFAQTLERHRDGILAYFDYQITTGPLEGINNKINTMKRQAYGFRDMEFFKLKIMALHETKYALVG